MIAILVFLLCIYASIGVVVGRIAVRSTETQFPVLYWIITGISWPLEIVFFVVRGLCKIFWLVTVDWFKFLIRVADRIHQWWALRFIYNDWS